MRHIRSLFVNVIAIRVLVRDAVHRQKSSFTEMHIMHHVIVVGANAADVLVVPVNRLRKNILGIGGPSFIQPHLSFVMAGGEIAPPMMREFMRHYISFVSE